MPKVMWTGPEHVRIISKADLGNAESDEVYEWSEVTRWMQDMSDEDYTKLVELTGPGTWSVVEVTAAEESSDASSESSSQSSKPQEVAGKGQKAGKSDES